MYGKEISCIEFVRRVKAEEAESATEISACMCDNEIVAEVIVFDAAKVGSVIGHAGSVIRKTQEDTLTKIAVTEWKENKEDKNGAIVRGTKSCVRHAMSIINKILTEEPSGKNKKPKSK